MSFGTRTIAKFERGGRSVKVCPFCEVENAMSRNSCFMCGKNLTGAYVSNDRNDSIPIAEPPKPVSDPAKKHLPPPEYPKYSSGGGVSSGAVAGIIIAVIMIVLIIVTVVVVNAQNTDVPAIGADTVSGELVALNAETAKEACTAEELLGADASYGLRLERAA